MTRSGSGVELLGRRRECQALDDLLTDVRAGTSAALILRGEAGIGKTALLDHAASRAVGCRVLRTAGVQSEMELSYAGLQLLCAPLLPGMAALPEPQRNALAAALGLSAADAPDRFMVGLAVLNLFADAAAERPLICVVDDVQWLDDASALTLGFVARRLGAESVLLLFSLRTPHESAALHGVSALDVTGLTDAASRELLQSVLPGRIADPVVKRILAEAGGNPLALRELPRGFTAPEMAGGIMLSGSQPVANQIERSFIHRIRGLPVDTRRLLVLAASDPLGDAHLFRRAARRLELDADLVLGRGEAAEFLLIDPQVHFRHPLMRSAAYRTASLEERTGAHRALAAALDADADADRRAWHRAHAVTAPDEEVARELLRSAETARSRGGVAAMAAFLDRAALLTPDPTLRSQRALDAAEAKLLAGSFDQAAGLVTLAEVGPSDARGRARIDLLEAQIALIQNRGNEAASLLLSAARHLEPVDIPLARQTHLDAIAAALYASHLADGPGLSDVGAAARSAPSAPEPEPADRLLDALAIRLTDGYIAGVAPMRRMLVELHDDRLPDGVALRWLLFGSVLASELWDFDRWWDMTSRQVDMVREAGALSELPSALDALVTVLLFAGDATAAADLVNQAELVCEAIGSPQALLGPLGLAAFRGREDEGRTLIAKNMAEATSRGQGAAVIITQWYRAVLCNSLSQYDEAVDAARQVAEHAESFTSPPWGLVELVEAASRSGETALAADAHAELSERLTATATPWALGVEARCRALVSDPAEAESWYQRAIEILAPTRMKTDLARSHLLYGEWLRRHHRRADAREQLHTAHRLFAAGGLDGFAERAGRELAATGAVVRRRAAPATTPLTAQEERIARLAGAGLTNPEIGARLFLSPHTVDWHLRKVFTKLDIASRRDIATALAPSDHTKPVERGTSIV